MMEFLYFPEDKSEYIPAVITLVIFMTAAFVTMYLFYKKSKKDEAKFDKEVEQKIYPKHIVEDPESSDK